MKARMFLENADDTVVTMKLTMTAKDWCQLRDDLSITHFSHPCPLQIQLKNSITTLLSTVRKIVWDDTPLLEDDNGRRCPGCRRIFEPPTNQCPTCAITLSMTAK